MSRGTLQPPRTVRPDPAAAISTKHLSGSLSRLLERLGAHDAYTEAHSRRVGTYSTLLARLLGFDTTEVEIVRRAALLHDVGKAGVPLEVLCKTGRLTDQEFEIIKQHPMIGSMMLEAADLKALVPMVLHHHEHWNGRGGYPTGLCGIDIPVQSRIILVADAFDAMTTNRPYGKVCTPDEAIVEIERCAGGQFDPLISEAMAFAFRAGLLEDGAMAALEDGASLHNLLEPSSV